MNSPYTIKYKVVIQHQEMPTDCDKDKFLPLYMELEEVVHLFDTVECGVDGWRTTDKTPKSAVISPKKWRNIALLTNPKCEEHHKLIGYGVEFIESSHVFRDKIDAGIQMAFIAAKVGIKTSMIREATDYIVTETGYEKLQELFYDDFPEKFI